MHTRGTSNNHFHRVGAHLWKLFIECFLRQASLVIGRQIRFVHATKLKIPHGESQPQHNEDNGHNGGGGVFHRIAGDASPETVIELQRGGFFLPPANVEGVNVLPQVAQQDGENGEGENGGLQHRRNGAVGNGFKEGLREDQHGGEGNSHHNG